MPASTAAPNLRATPEAPHGPSGAKGSGSGPSSCKACAQALCLAAGAAAGAAASRSSCRQGPPQPAAAVSVTSEARQPQRLRPLSRSMALRQRLARPQALSAALLAPR